MSGRGPALPPKFCTKCGKELTRWRPRATGMCQKCFCRTGRSAYGKRRVMGICYRCHKRKPCPGEKDPRYFICDDCWKDYAEHSAGDRWMDGMAIFVPGDDR